MPNSAVVRFNETFLSNHERRLLVAIARRLPRWVTPDGLTWFGVFGAGLVTLGGWLSRDTMGWLWLANLGLLVHWFGDSLDGTVARHRQIERPRYGFYFDQVIDTVGNLLISLGEGLCPAMRMDLALIMLAVYQMLSLQVLVRAIVDREFHMAVGRMGPTEMRIGIFLINLLIMVFGARGVPGLPGGLRWEDLVVSVAIIGLLFLFALQMRSHMSRLASEERAEIRAEP